MNKIIALMLVVFSVLLCVSCNNTSNTESTVTTDILSPGSVVDYPATTPPVVLIYPYRTFEEMCELATDVVVARIIKPPEEYGEDHWKYTVEVSETVVGEASGVLELYIPTLSCQATTPDGYVLNFGEVGVESYLGTIDEEILLILTRKADVYSTPQINYVWNCATVIPLNNLKQSDMYMTGNWGGLTWFKLSTEHFTGIDTQTCTREEMIEYVRGLTEDNAPGKTLSDAETLEEIVADAPAIFQVKPIELLTEVKGDLKHTEIWHCEIVETLKGSVMGEIQVIFFADTVEVGEEYIVAVEGIDSDVFYGFITKDSLRPVSEKEEIRAYIAQNN